MQGKVHKLMRQFVFFSASLIFSAVVLGWMVHTGVFFQTGNQWFQSCWTQDSAARAPATPNEAIEWSKCEPVTERAFYGSGFVPMGSVFDIGTPEIDALDAACPRKYTDFSQHNIGRMRGLAVHLIVKTGGPTLLDAFTPPDSMIERAFKSRWPNCQAVAKANGFPKIILRGGKWEFESPCKPCEKAPSVGP